MADYNITLAMGGTGTASIGTPSNRIQIQSGTSFSVQISSGITASGSKGVGQISTQPYTTTHAFENQGTSSGVYTRTYGGLSPTLVGNDFRLLWVGYLDGVRLGSIANENYQNGVMYFTVAEAPGQSHHTATGVSCATTASASTTATISTSGGTGTLQTAAVNYYWPPPTDTAFSNGNTQTVTRGGTY